MEDLLRGYESFEAQSLELTKMTSEFQELLDMYDNLTVLQKVSQHYSSEAAQIFLAERFGLEADDPTAAGTGNKAAATDPTTGGNVSKKDPNNDGKNTAAAGNSIWNRLGGLKEKISSAFKGMQVKCRQFWGQAVSYATQLTTNLTQKADEIAKTQNNLNYQVSGVCENINDVQLTPIFTQLQGAKSKDELGKIVGDLKARLADMLMKEPKSYSKENFVKLLATYAEANKRVISERNAASTMFESTANKTEQAQDKDEMNLREQQANASMSVSNILLGFIFKNTTKLLGIAVKGMKKNG